MSQDKLGFKTKSVLDIGYFYAPYIPLQTINVNMSINIEPSISIVAVEEIYKDGVKYFKVKSAVDPDETNVFFMVWYNWKYIFFNDVSVYAGSFVDIDGCYRLHKDHPALSEIEIDNICDLIAGTVENDICTKIKAHLLSTCFVAHKLAEQQKPITPV